MEKPLREFAKTEGSDESVENILLKEGTFDLLLMLSEGPRSFIELRRGGHSPNTILARLREVQRRGLVESKLFLVKRGRKPRIKYILTAEGQKIVGRYMPVKTSYLELKRDIEYLEDRIHEQKQALKLLLASMKLHK